MDVLTKKKEFAAFEVRTGSDGKRGIYLRRYNVRLATFNRNSADLQSMLTEIFDRVDRDDDG